MLGGIFILFLLSVFAAAGGDSSGLDFFIKLFFVIAVVVELINIFNGA